MSIKEVYDWYAKEGYLNAVPSPDGTLVLYKYTQRTVFETNWNYHTKTARGLVLDLDGNIVARPWGKFFNLNETEESHARNLPQGELPELGIKYDGSLIIIFWHPFRKHWQAVTQGSWDNVQTAYAMSWLDHNAEKLTDKGRTYLFELIAPWNRIVVGYTKEDMIYIGSVENLSGADESYADARAYAELHGLTPMAFHKAPIASVDLERQDVMNEEGYVARFPSGLRVKLKYAVYLMLHRILTGLSVKNIWESLSNGHEEEFKELVPDEFKDWYNAEKCKLQQDFLVIESMALAAFGGRPQFNVAEWAANGLACRKVTAEYFKQYHSLTGILFTMLDGEDYRKLIWKKIRPQGHKVFNKGPEDIAFDTEAH